jgi:hypothetical protein
MVIVLLGEQGHYHKRGAVDGKVIQIELNGKSKSRRTAVKRSGMKSDVWPDSLQDRRPGSSGYPLRIGTPDSLSSRRISAGCFFWSINKLFV